MLNEIGGLAAGLAHGMNLGMQWKNMNEQQKLQKRQMDRLEKGDVRDTEKHEIEMKNLKREQSRQERHEALFNIVSTLDDNGDIIPPQPQQQPQPVDMQASTAQSAEAAPTPSSIQSPAPLPQQAGLAAPAQAAPFATDNPAEALKPSPVQATPQPQGQQGQPQPGQPQMPQPNGVQKVGMQILSGQFGFSPKKMHAIGQHAMRLGLYDESMKFFDKAQQASDKGYLRAGQALLRNDPQGAAGELANAGVKLMSIPVRADPKDPHSWRIHVDGGKEEVVNIRDMMRSVVDGSTALTDLDKQQDNAFEREKWDTAEKGKILAETATEKSQGEMYKASARRQDRMPQARQGSSKDIDRAIKHRGDQLNLASTVTDEITGKQVIDPKKRLAYEQAAMAQEDFLETELNEKLDARDHRIFTNAMLSYPVDSKDPAVIQKWQNELLDQYDIVDDKKTAAADSLSGKGARREAVNTPEALKGTPKETPKEAPKEPTREEQELEQLKYTGAEDIPTLKRLHKERTASNHSAKDRAELESKIAALLAKHSKKTPATAGLKTARHRAPSSDPEVAPAGYGKREDGTDKGSGWLGEHKSAKGNVMTEYTVGLNIGGKDVDVPTFVPGLTPKELAHLKTEPDFKERSPINESILRKAADHAKGRMKEGKSVFADNDKKVYGYEVREPYDSEKKFFKSNKNVSGMATEDGRIILNEHSGLTPDRQQAVARNEATRLYIREKGYKFDFPVTEKQKEQFKGTAYGEKKNLHHLQSTIIARIIAGDPSAGDATPEQRKAAERIKRELEQRG